MQKNQKHSPLEVLAPAGNLECFYAAINSNADAIYLGLSSFNARMKADNFTEENIREVTKFAHLHGVKIYVTVNILLEDQDFETHTGVDWKRTLGAVGNFIFEFSDVEFILSNEDINPFKCF